MNAARTRTRRYLVWAQSAFPPYPDKALSAHYSVEGRYGAARWAEELVEAGFLRVHVVDEHTGRTVWRPAGAVAS